MLIFGILCFLLDVSSARLCRWSQEWAVLGPVQRNVTASFLTLAPEPKRAFDVTGCTFLAYSDAFLSIIDSSSLRTVAQKNYSFAHEAGVYVPKLDAVFFTSNRLGNTSSEQQFTEVSLLHLSNNSVTVLRTTPPIIMANGAILDTTLGSAAGGGGKKPPKPPSSVLVLSQGNMTAGGAIVRLNLETLTVAPLLDNWQGLQFSSPNDIIVHPRSGFVFFTDPSYGYEQGFRPAPQLGEYLWAFDPADGTATVAADGFVKPNGLALSPDGKRMYISDTGFFRGDGSWDPARPHYVYVADVISGGRGIGARRMFATCSSGIPDGLKVDFVGNLYTGCGDGVHVFAPSGKELGVILVGGVANFALTNRSIVMLQETVITAVSLITAGSSAMQT